MWCGINNKTSFSTQSNLTPQFTLFNVYSTIFEQNAHNCIVFHTLHFIIRLGFIYTQFVQYNQPLNNCARSVEYAAYIVNRSLHSFCFICCCCCCCFIYFSFIRSFDRFVQFALAESGSYVERVYGLRIQFSIRKVIACVAHGIRFFLVGLVRIL